MEAGRNGGNLPLVSICLCKEFARYPNVLKFSKFTIHFAEKYDFQNKHDLDIYLGLLGSLGHPAY